MKLIFAIIMFTLTAVAYGQTGVITIKDNAGAGELIEKHIYFNKEHGELPGYRIQVMATTSLMSAKDSKALFLQRYENYHASIVFEAPNYKVRVGNYMNRFDANRDLQDLLVEYPEAYIVKDLINITEQ
ncbi:MAG: SPOR domain-containing protein [Chitinophagales bacterium]